MRLFTGSDDFGGFVTFAPGSTQFETGVPAEETTLLLATRTAAPWAARPGPRGRGREVGAEAGAGAYELAQLFINGEATDAGRPFFTDDLMIG